MARGKEQQSVQAEQSERIQTDSHPRKGLDTQELLRITADGHIHHEVSLIALKFVATESGMQSAPSAASRTNVAGADHAPEGLKRRVGDERIQDEQDAQNQR